MPTWLIILLVVISLFDLIIVLVAIPALIRHATGPLSRAFPPTDASPDAVWRRKQMVGIGLMNLGGCYDLGADDFGIHARPTKIGRFFKADGFSVPWDQVHIHDKPSIWAGGNAKLGMHVVKLPRWLRELARPGSAL